MIISQTPLRISICGGGTDFKEYYEKHEGFVLSAAIDKYVFVIVKERFDDLIYVNYTKKEIVKSFDELEHELVREAARKTNLPVGVEITMLADIPSEGSGLGSSSSLTVGLLNAFYNYMGKQVTAEQLASEASEIEIDILKKPIGKQDQYIAAYGGLATIHFKKDDTVEVNNITTMNGAKRKFGTNLLLYYTNVTRKSSSILAEQKKCINDKIEVHNKIKCLAHKAAEVLENEQIDKIGGILSENWQLKKQLASAVTNCKIDKMFETAMSGGAGGGKISGAGGGGFMLLYCCQDKQDKLREAMHDYREMPFMLERFGSKIIFDYRRYEWK